jgi:hypothetical protein
MLSCSRVANGAVIVFNLALLLFIVYKFFEAPPIDKRGWVWLAVFMGCPAINLLGLLGIVHRLFIVLATFTNAAAVLVWGGLIGLMMVWPMGNKPKGIEAVVLIGSWLFLVLTEVVLVRMAVAHRSETF